MMNSMNMAGMNPAQGGPVGGGMMMMNNGTPATPSNSESLDNMKQRLNTYIYDYFLNFGYIDHARALVQDEKFDISVKPHMKSSPGGRRKEGEINGVDENAMDTDSKDDLTLIPDDLPRPQIPNECPGSAFLFDWFCLFHDIFRASAQRAKKPGQRDGTPAQTYLDQTQQIQRIRESQQSAQLMRNPQMMSGQSQFANLRQMRNGMAGTDMRTATLSKHMSPQQMQQMHHQQMIKQQQQQQHQMQREHSDMDMNGHRPQSPSDPENPGSPSKRPRLGEQQFNGQMGPNGRGQGVPGVGPHGGGMLMQAGINQKAMGQGQFQGFSGQNQTMQQKMMQGAMQNGIMNPNVMANQGSPMMQPMSDAQFMSAMPMGDIYGSQMRANGAMQGPGTATGGNHALQDYQMQLMLLEQQNKKRLMMARQEQDNVSRDPTMSGQPGMPPPGMSPSGSRTGNSPNPSEQMKRTPGLGSPAPGDIMPGRGSPGPMGFIGGMPQEFGNSMLTRNGVDGMSGPAGHGMRPGPNLGMEAMTRAQQGNKMPGGNWQAGPQGQPMMQQQPQGQPPPMGTPGQRSEMPPPQAPATGSANANRTQPSSPQPGQPPTPSQASKPAPKKKGKEEQRKRPNKKNSTANAPASSEPEPPATPTPSTPITPQHPNTFTGNGKGALATTTGGAASSNPAPTSNPSIPQNQQQIPPPDSMPGPGHYGDPNFSDHAFNLDFSSLESTDVLNDFDFDSFLNTDDGTNWPIDPNLGQDFSMETAGVE